MVLVSVLGCRLYWMLGCWCEGVIGWWGDWSRLAVVLVCWRGSVGAVLEPLETVSGCDEPLLMVVLLGARGRVAP